MLFKTMINAYLYIGVEVLTAVTMKNYIFWDVTPCTSKGAGRFGVTHRLPLPGTRVRQARNLQKQAAQSAAWFCWFLTRPTLLPWKWRYAPPKRRTLFELNVGTTQTTALFLYFMLFKNIHRTWTTYLYSSYLLVVNIQVHSWNMEFMYIFRILL
jgi:hypothetical protein